MVQTQDTQNQRNQRTGAPLPEAAPQRSVSPLAPVAENNSPRAARQAAMAHKRKMLGRFSPANWGASGNNSHQAARQAAKWLERGLSAGKKPRRRRRGKGDGEGMCSYTGMLHGPAPLTITSLEEEGALWLGDECVTSPSTPQHGPVEIEVPDYKVGIGR